jgi:hypothetical protein
MKLIEGLNYRQWQKRNKEHFQSLSKAKQKELRKQGYCNIGWNRVKKSWKILVNDHSSYDNLSENADNVISLFEHKLNQKDLQGAIQLSIMEADNAKKIAQQALQELEENQKRLAQLATESLNKYSLL